MSLRGGKLQAGLVVTLQRLPFWSANRFNEPVQSLVTLLAGSGWQQRQDACDAAV